MRRAPSLFLVILLLGFALACGGGGSAGTANLRFIQGSPDASTVDYLVDGTTESSNLSYGNASTYASVKSGSRHVQIIPVNSTKPLLDQTVSLADSANETLILTGPVAQLKPLVLDDGTTTGTTSSDNVRVVSISNNMGPADVYIVPAGTSLSGATPVAKGLDFDQNTGYVGTGATAGNVDVYLTKPGTQSVYLTTGSVNLSVSTKQTILVLDSPTGGFTFTLLTDQ
ncbi:MAG TPA: DUF4397 domain-containing protein [Terriglobales bacterium]|nr:DUF4397 domain-containing protein [Terriglobales bacterium]